MPLVKLAVHFDVACCCFLFQLNEVDACFIEIRVLHVVVGKWMDEKNLSFSLELIKAGGYGFCTHVMAAEQSCLSLCHVAVRRHRV
jgi:hypothetical protein